MPANPVLEKLRQQVGCLEETHRRFSHTIPVADAIDAWLPHGGLPTRCIHEIKGKSLASAIAFSAILAARATKKQGNLLYIAPDRSLHPLGLLSYGVHLNQLLHISVRKPRDLSWATMEAVRCSQVGAVMAVVEGLDLTASRRLQLAAETSGTTCFLLGYGASAPIASPITRWNVSPASSQQRFDEPTWELNLLYCRGGRPGKWILRWHHSKLNALPAQFSAIPPGKQTVRQAWAG